MEFTKEDLTKALNTDEGKSILSSIIEKEKEGVLSKNKELLSDIKSMKEKFGKLESDKIKAQEDAAASSGDIDKLREQLEARHSGEIESLKSANGKLASQLETHVIGEGLTQALVKAKIAPQLMDAAKALIKQSFKGEVGDNDGTPFAKFDGRAVNDFVTSWSQTESGKHFVSADGNSGGGSNGANGQGNAKADGKKTMTREAFRASSPSEKMELSKAGVVVTDE